MASLSLHSVTHQLGTLIFSFSLFGATATLSDDRNNFRSEFGKIELFIKKSAARKELLEQRARTLEAQIDDLRTRAVKLAEEAQLLEKTLSKIDDRLSDLAYENKVNQSRLKNLNAHLMQSVVSLVRLRRMPEAAMLVGSETLLDTIRARRLLAVSVPRLQRDAIKLSELLSSTYDLRQNLKNKKKRRKLAIAALSARQTELTKLLKKRAAREHRLREDGKSEGRRLVNLVSKARNLSNLIQRLEREPPARRFSFSRRSTKEKPSQITRKAERNRRKLGAEFSSTSETTPSKLSKSESLRPKPISPETDLPKQKLGLGTPTQPFSTLRGQLRLPAHGKTVGQFGESLGFGTRSQGITLRTRQGAQVVAPYDGLVLFAGPFRNYGLILIVAHGEGYHTLLAGLSKLQAFAGQYLLTGEPMGTMGGDNKRSLYIELRRKGKPINPDPWWSGIRERVSG